MGRGIGRAGPAVAGFFTNLTPLLQRCYPWPFWGEALTWVPRDGVRPDCLGIVQSSRR